MFYLPNITGVLWFAHQVWPRVMNRVPQATLTIAGKNPPPEIQALSTSNDRGTPIQITGYLPDLQPYLERAAVFIVPRLAMGAAYRFYFNWR
jgi:hypothetical protein